jgi:hypothetical protein
MKYMIIKRKVSCDWTCYCLQDNPNVIRTEFISDEFN